MLMRWKRFRRKFGISAPRVVVRSHALWLERGALLGVGLLLGGLVAAGFVGGDPVSALPVSMVREREAAHVMMASAAEQGLLARIRELEEKNALLREELLFFQRLLPKDGEPEVLRIEALRVNALGADRYAYRTLLAYDPGRSGQPFRGQMRWYAILRKDGVERRQEIVDRATKGERQLELRGLLRREGEFELQSSAGLRGFELVILAGEQVRARYYVDL